MQVDIWVVLIAGSVAIGTTWYSTGGRGGHTRRRVEQEIAIRDSLHDARLAKLVNEHLERRVVNYLDASSPSRYRYTLRQQARILILALVYGAIGLGATLVGNALPSGAYWQFLALVLLSVTLGLIGSLAWVGGSILVRSTIAGRLVDREADLQAARTRLGLSEMKTDSANVPRGATHADSDAVAATRTSTQDAVT